MIRNVSSNWLLTGLQVAVTFTLLPFTLKALGESQYGTWVLVTSMTSYLSMLALGVPMATVRFVANFAGSGDEEALNRTVGSCAGLYLIIGAVSLAVGLVLYGVFLAVYELPAGLAPEANAAFLVVVVTISVSFVGQLPYGILSAHHEFVLRNAVQGTALLLRLTLTVLLLRWIPTLLWLALIQLALFAFEFTVAMAIVRRRWPAIRIRLRDFDRTMVHRILGFSLYVMLLNIGGQLVFQTAALVIGAYEPVEVIPLFTVPSSLTVYLIEFVIGIGAVVMPAAATLQARGDLAAVREIFLKWSKITVTLTAAAGLYLLILGPRFLGWWIGADFEFPAGRVLGVLMIGNLFFLPVRGVALPLLMGLGKPRAPALTFLAIGLLNLAISLVLVRSMGIEGVAIGTAVPNILFAVIVLALALRETGVGVGTYLGYAVARTVVAAVPVAAFLVWWRERVDIPGLPGLVLGGLASMSLYGALTVLWVYRGDPRIDLYATLRARFAPPVKA